MKAILAPVYALLLGGLYTPAQGQEATNVLAYYSGSVQLPPELHDAYLQVVGALKRGDADKIESFASSNVVVAARDSVSPPIEGRGERGKINLRFGKEYFNEQILVIQRRGEGEYLLRTGTTAFVFKKDKNGEWKLSDYLEKPIK